MKRELWVILLELELDIMWEMEIILNFGKMCGLGIKVFRNNILGCIIC